MEGKKSDNIKGNDNTKKLGLKNKKKVIKISIVLLIILIIFCAAYSAGFIPIKELMTIKQPIGNYEKIDIDSYLETYPELANLPNLDKIKHVAYGTDESNDAVISDYKQELENEGYSLKYEGISNFGEKPFEYYGFLKGITAVVIIVTEDNNEEFDYESIVLYTTGNALDYKEILDLYEENL